MVLWIAILLGLVQGVFMFLPVSSTAHLVLVQHWLISRGHELPAPESPEMILFDLVVHVGTLVSIVVVFWPSFRPFCRQCVEGALRWAGRPGARLPLQFRLFMLGMFSVLITGVIGLALRAIFEQVFASPMLVAFNLVLTGILLWWTDALPRRRRGLKGINLGVAGVIGSAQALALMPGLSRSAMTMVFGLFTGLKRRWTAEYSFFLAIPTILAATAIQSVDVVGHGGLNGLGVDALAAGFVTAALVGIVALRAVLYLLYRARLKLFSFYVWALAISVLLGLGNVG
jgi:undecaprenyl-diphosphatase